MDAGGIQVVTAVVVVLHCTLSIREDVKLLATVGRNEIMSTLNITILSKAKVPDP